MVGLTRAMQWIRPEREHRAHPHFIDQIILSFQCWSIHEDDAIKLFRTWNFLIGAYICCCLLLAHVKRQITRSLMYANYFALIDFHTRANKHLTSFLCTRKCIRSSSSILKSNLHISFLHFKVKLTDEKETYFFHFFPRFFENWSFRWYRELKGYLRN